MARSESRELPLTLIILMVVFFKPIRNDLCEKLPFYGKEVKTEKQPGDGDFWIWFERGQYGYIPSQKFDVFLYGSGEKHFFSRFVMSLKVYDPKTKELRDGTQAEVGKLKPADEFTIKNLFCNNTLSEAIEEPTEELQMTWTAPDSDNCVAIVAIVYQSPDKWFAYDEKLTKIICPTYDDDDEDVEPYDQASYLNSLNPKKTDDSQNGEPVKDEIFDENIDDTESESDESGASASTEDESETVIGIENRIVPPHDEF